VTYGIHAPAAREPAIARRVRNTLLCKPLSIANHGRRDVEFARSRQAARRGVRMDRVKTTERRLYLVRLGKKTGPTSEHVPQ